MYAWCLVIHASMDPGGADREALERYPFQAESDPYRGLIFHDEAWHWAMLRLHGEQYWVKSPHLQTASAAYREESERFDCTSDAT
jgi:hypothetical protein